MARDTVTLVEQKSHHTRRDGTTASYLYYTLRWYDPQTGKRRGKNIGKVGELPKREARKKRDLLAAELARHPARRNPERAPRLGDHCTYFLECKRAEGAAEGTLEAYGYASRLLMSHFGEETRLDSISTRDARRFKFALAAGELTGVERRAKRRVGIAPATVEKHMRHVRAIFGLAVRDEGDALARNPFAGVRGKAPPPKDWHPVSLETFWRLYAAAPGGWKLLLALCRLAALRRSDALALRWGDLDLEQGVICFTTIKTGRRQRVPICVELKEVLDAARPDACLLQDKVVPQRNAGDPRRRRGQDPHLVYVGNIGRDVRRMCRRAGIPSYRDPCHTLRKSCINDWARREPAHVVQAWAGHGSIAITMKFYSKVGPEDERRGQQRLGDKKRDTEQHGPN